MGVEIEIGQETLQLLDRYCNPKIRPTDLAALVSRIIEPWYTQAVKKWVKSPELIPKLEKIPEGKKQKIMISSVHGKNLRNTLEAFNLKMGTNIDEAELVTWMCSLYIKMYRIKEKEKGYKLNMGQIKRV